MHPERHQRTFFAGVATAAHVEGPAGGEDVLKRSAIDADFKNGTICAEGELLVPEGERPFGRRREEGLDDPGSP